MKTSRLQVFLNSLGALLMSALPMVNLFTQNHEMQRVREHVDRYPKLK